MSASMARLNDAGAVPVDALELLRRKYSRQNKEIARINSSQCIRIRNLENEVSRLLAENLELREQMLRLQSEAKSKRAHQIMDHVSAIKTNLEAKLQEIGLLVTTLGDEPPQPPRHPAKVGKRVRSSPTKSPDERNWKNMCTLTEAVGLDDGRLPPILEDKSYPRRTLEPAELMEIHSDHVADNTDSPDIGPPPVSNFINEDPVKINLPSRTEKDTEESQDIDPALSINLEQRRKRKDSSGSQAPKKPSRFEPSLSSAGKEVAQSLKAGAKRKLSIRDDDYGMSTAGHAETSPDDFKYTRRATDDQQSNKVPTAADRTITKTSRDIAVARGLGREKNGSAVTTTSRRALGPKTTNTDMVKSPRKSTKPGMLDDISSERRDPNRGDQAKERTRDRGSGVVMIKPNIESIPTSINIEPEPETPMAPDIFSPPASGSSAVGAQSRDTPPPADLGPGTEGQRPNRRARGSVSYALPNLRDKMRRPTNELVDAVTGEGKAQRLSMNKLENDGPTTAIKIKEELEAEDAWKNLPSTVSVNVYSKSPLIDKVALREQLPEATISERQQRRRSLMHSDSNSELLKSGSSSAISALMANSRKFKQEPKNRVEPSNTIEDAMAKLDIYEFTGSPPREASIPKIAASKEDRRASKSSRRLSSMEDMASGTAGESSDGESKHILASSISRRRQSMIGPGSSAPNTGSVGRRSGDSVRKATSQADLHEATETELRNERVSARRRSMML